MTVTKETIEQTIKQAFEEWQLDINGWTFKWNNRKRAFGTCYFNQKLITVSKWLFDNTVPNQREKFIDTVYHEVAHALAGARAGHGYEWKEWARLLGADPTSCGSVEKIDKMAGVKYVIQYNGEIVKTYFRKPSQHVINTISTRSMRGIPSSFGKLKIAKVCKVGLMTIFQQIN